MGVRRSLLIRQKFDSTSLTMLFEWVDKVIYINLAHRKDRRAHIEKTLRRAFPPHKIVRFNAIRDIPPWRGCSKSHAAALELAIANKWGTVLIVEDDMEWYNFDSGYAKILEVIKNPWDAIVLGGTSRVFDEKTYRLESCSSTTAYLVAGHYKETLLENFKEGIRLLTETGDHTKYSVDRYWNLLQKKDTWFITYPSTCKQIAGYTDIGGRFMDFTYAFQ
jgi:glycosyl transferase family 25